MLNNMYELMRLEDELNDLKIKVKNGEQCQSIIDRIFEIEMLLDNIYYTERE